MSSVVRVIAVGLRRSILISEMVCIYSGRDKFGGGWFVEEVVRSLEFGKAVRQQRKASTLLNDLQILVFGF
jgi:hypothetical protein